MAHGIDDITVKTQRGDEKSLGDYKGHPLLIVNLASRCGYTPQYAGLERLNRRTAGKGCGFWASRATTLASKSPAPTRRSPSSAGQLRGDL